MIDEIYNWLINTPITVENKKQWEALSNTIWWKFKTEPISVTNSMMVQVFQLAKEGGVLLPNTYVLNNHRIYKNLFKKDI